MTAGKRRPKAPPSLENVELGAPGRAASKAASKALEGAPCIDFENFFATAFAFFKNFDKMPSSQSLASLSSRGLGHDPLTVRTGVRIPIGTPKALHALQFLQNEPPLMRLFCCLRAHSPLALPSLFPRFSFPARPFSFCFGPCRGARSFSIREFLCAGLPTWPAGRFCRALESSTAAPRPTSPTQGAVLED